MIQDEITDLESIDITSQYNMRLPLGTILQNGTYRIIKVLAQGGFGITYLAEDMVKHQNVVIKEYYKKEWHTRNSTTSYVSKNVSTTEIEGKFRKKFEKEAHTDNIARWVPPVALLWYRCFMRTNISYHSCGTAHI